jgi:hypothetical protein
MPITIPNRRRSLGGSGRARHHFGLSILVLAAEHDLLKFFCRTTDLSIVFRILDLGEAMMVRFLRTGDRNPGPSGCSVLQKPRNPSEFGMCNHGNL